MKWGLGNSGILGEGGLVEGEIVEGDYSKNALYEILKN